jgi:tRNA1(Val) A37 N6-methylase TrmN6
MEPKTLVLSPDGLKYSYSPGIAPPGADSFALAAFAADFIGGRAGRACDLGAGGGLISILLAKRCSGLVIDGIESDGGAAEAFEKNLAQLPPGRINAVRGDIRNINAYLTRGLYDYAISNPPYFEARSGGVSRQNGNARSELACGIADICSAAGYLLKHGGVK